MKKLRIIEVKNVDMMLLQRQRQLLIAKLWDDKDSELWGLVEMLDEIEDYALENEPFNVLEDCSVHFSVSVRKDDSTANKSHWDEDEKYPVKDWQYEVANDDTRIGYLEWIEHTKEQSED